MRKTLTQTEIDALFSKAQASQVTDDRKTQKNVVPCDLRRCNQLGADQVAAVTTLHEAFARRLTDSLGAQMRITLSANLVSVEQLTYRELLSRLPDLTYVASLHVMPIDVRSALQCDISLIYPMIDVLLGGTGATGVEPRELTELEEQIVETAFHVMVQNLNDTWAPVLDLDFRFQLRQSNLQIQGMMLPSEKILCLSFELHLAETAGTFAIVFPAVVASALIRRLALQGSSPDRAPSRESRSQIRGRLLGSLFKADLSLPGSPLPIRKLLSLEPDNVLMLPRRADEPIHLNIAGKPMFTAYPARKGSNRCARVEGRIPTSTPVSREPAEQSDIR